MIRVPSCSNNSTPSTFSTNTLPSLILSWSRKEIVAGCISALASHKNENPTSSIKRGFSVTILYVHHAYVMTWQKYQRKMTGKMMRSKNWQNCISWSNTELVVQRRLNTPLLLRPNGEEGEVAIEAEKVDQMEHQFTAKSKGGKNGQQVPRK